MNLKKNLANILTLTNFSMGMIAILMASLVPSGTTYALTSKHILTYILASTLILIAGFTDRFDGKVARHFETVSDPGKQLDSLSDLVSFGVAPALLTWKIHATMSTTVAPLALQILTYAITLFFPLAGALRLAKFNVQEDPSYFVGIPITLAGMFTCFLNILFLRFSEPLQPGWLIQVSILLLIGIAAVLMISRFKVKKR